MNETKQEGPHSCLRLTQAAARPLIVCSPGQSPHSLLGGSCHSQGSKYHLSNDDIPVLTPAQTSPLSSRLQPACVHLTFPLGVSNSIWLGPRFCCVFIVCSSPTCTSPVSTDAQAENFTYSLSYLHTHIYSTNRSFQFVSKHTRHLTRLSSTASPGSELR